MALTGQAAETWREGGKQMRFSFDSGVDLGKKLPDFAELVVKNEPMLFNCSVEASRSLGGPITNAFLDALGVWGTEGVVDTRVHMLMPGWYSCIPGWHHDDVPRSREDGQPNYVTPEYRAEHVMCLINGDICPTQFAVGRCEMPEVALGGTVYGVWNDEVEIQIKKRNLARFTAPSNQLVFFNSESFHRGTMAVRSGWRWFGRLTTGTGRKATNELRKQVQVYLPQPTQGW
jgi:hypothetical protein